MKNHFSFIVTLLCIAQSFYGQTRSYSNEFLAIGVDAAALGKSNAVVASAKNVNAAYWNPAGLVHLKNKQVALMHSSYFANIANYDYAAFATPLENNAALGFSLIRFGVDDIIDSRLLAVNENTPVRNLPRFSTADYAFTISYAKTPLEKNFQFGVNAKVIRRVIGKFASAWGFGLDASLQGKLKKFNYGIIVRDLTTTYNSWQIDDDIFDSENTDPDNPINRQEVPEKTEITIPSVQLGLSRDFSIRRDFTINAEVDLNLRFSETNDLISTPNFTLNPAAGFELGFKNFIFLRGGVGNFQNIQQFDGSDQVSFQPNFGIGFHYKGISLDYALTDIGDQSEALYSNVFSLIIDWRLFNK